MKHDNAHAMLMTKEVNMAVKRVSKKAIVKGGFASSVDFVSLYKKPDGSILTQTNKIEDYSTSTTPNKVFSVGDTTKSIIKCEKDATLGCDMVSLQTEGFDAATIAAFDALVASGTISNLSVDKTDPAKPVIKFPADNIKLTESTDGRGFCLTAGTGSDTVTVEVGVREISVKSSSGIDQKIPHPDPDKTYNLELSKQLVKDCFDTSKDNRAIYTSTAGTETPVKQLSDLSTEFAVALARIEKPESGKNFATAEYEINGKTLKFLTGYEIAGLDNENKSITNDVVIVKETDSSSTKIFLLQDGAFKQIKETKLVYGNNAMGTRELNDLSVCFSPSRGYTIEVPIQVEKDSTDTDYKDNENLAFLNAIIDLTEIGKTTKGLEDKTTTTSAGVTETQHFYRDIELNFDDGTKTSMINSKVALSISSLGSAPAVTATSPLSAAPSADDDAPAEPMHVVTTKHIKDLDKLTKSFGQVGLLAGFFLAVGAVLMPALLPAAIGVLAAGAGLYYGSNLVSGNYDITLDKMINAEKKRVKTREKACKKFLALDAKIERIKSEIAPLKTEIDKLFTLIDSSSISPTDKSALHDPYTDRATYEDIINSSSLSATEKAELIALKSVHEEHQTKLEGLRDKLKPLENKAHRSLANADFRTIEAIKSQIGEQAAKDKETELKAAFDTAHASTRATKDEVDAFKQDLNAKKKDASIEAENNFIENYRYPITRNVMEHAREDKTKNFLVYLNTEQQGKITGTAREFADAKIDDQRLNELEAKAMIAPGLTPDEQTERDKLENEADDRNNTIKKFFGPDHSNSKKQQTYEQSFYNETESKSYQADWTADYVERHNKFDAAEKRLEDRGASDADIKHFRATRNIFEQETGKSRDAKILESTKASTDEKKKVNLKIQKRRDDAGIDSDKLSDPDLIL